MRVSVDTKALPEVGASLVSNDDKTVGEVVVSAFDEQGHVELLAVMNTKVTEEAMPVFSRENPLPFYRYPTLLSALIQNS
ncbi:hypothetical protein HSBAA_31760 [Vreelandella sulfidaeris]|uniref:Uncharacterized protein n=1 Tax=Vreelandella sulfidaeris TaxID=115553 RepID=A0A455U6T7_9GAMM|nr:hypothetical protein HSBAA_31760 [Halomonas sulfidaeris]